MCQSMRVNTQDFTLRTRMRVSGKGKMGANERPSPQGWIRVSGQGWGPQEEGREDPEV